MLRRFSFVFIAYLCCAVAVSFGQVDYATSTLRGAVVDPQGHPIVSAQVTLTNVSTGETKVAVTNDKGYLIPVITPGTYRVEAEAKGFATSIANDVVLTVGQLAQYDIHLKPSSVHTSIEVKAHIPVVHPSQTQYGFVVEVPWQWQIIRHHQCQLNECEP